MTTIRPRRARLLVLAVALATLLTSIAAPVAAVDGQAFVSAANAKRAKHNLPPVAWHAAVDTVTVERAKQLAARDKMEHDLAYVARRLGELGVCVTGYGEILYWERGYPSFDPQRAVDAWYKSTAGHKEIMLGNYNAAAGSWKQNASSGGVFAVMVFVKLCSAPAPSDPSESVRVAGTDRYATAAALSKASYPAKVPVAYVATGANFPDALAAGPAAAKAGGPVLLVTRTGIPSVTATELARLKPAKIVVLGASGVVSDGVRKDLRRYATTGTVTRIAGKDRYQTAALVSSAHFDPGVSVAYVATGANFPDALAGGAAAGLRDGPILLTKSTELPSATLSELKRLRPAKIVILGSSAIVSDKVAKAMAAQSGAPVSRVYGANRYATAVNLSKTGYKANEPSTVYVATGANFPDGLAGSPVAGSEPGPLLLVPKSTLPSVVATELKRLAPDKVVVLGGTGAISNAVVKAIDAAVP